MHYFDRHPNHFRFFFGLLAGALFLFGLIIVYRSASTPTDENLFTNPPTDLYVYRTVPGVEDSVRVGDLLIQVNDQNVFDEESFRTQLAEAEGDIVKLKILRLAENRRFSITIPKSNVTREFFRAVGPTAQVIAVTAEGASARAGMKVGDLIVRINGQRFVNAFDADRIMREAQIGKEIAYDIIRNNEMLTLDVVMAAFGMPISSLMMTLSGLITFAVGAFLGFARPRFRAARLSGLAYVAIGFFTMVVLNSRGGFVANSFDIVRNILLLLTLFFAFPLSFHASHYFPVERPELISQPWIRWVAYGLGLLGIGSIFLLNYAGFFIGILGVLAYLGIITLVFRKQASEEYRRMNRPVRVVSIVAVLGSLFLTLFITVTNQAPSLGYVGLFILLVPLTQLYIIGRYRLLDLDLRIRRNVQYIIVTSLWNLTLAVLVIRLLLTMQEFSFPIPNIHFSASSIEILETPLDPFTRLWYEKGILMFLAVVVVALALKARRIGQRLIDKKFYRAQYDYRKAATELSEMMATTLSMKDLAQGMVEKLAELMQLKRVGVLFFRDQQVCCCQEAYGSEGDEWKEFCIQSDVQLSEAINAFRGEVSVDYFPPAIKTELRRHGFQFVVPVRSKEKLVGALLVGEKRSEAPFDSEDLSFLSSVAKQASVAIENAFLYEELTKQERLKHELEIARRIQTASLPQHTPVIAGLDVAGKSVPAMEVGGDYYDYLNNSAEKLMVIVGDVSGKGTSAALYMSKVQGILRSLHEFGLSPKELFVRANKLLCNDLEKKSFVTALGGLFLPSEQRLILARAGHLPLYLFRAKEKRVERIVPKGLGLGLESTELFSMEMEEKEMRYEAGDVFMFVSDGVTDAEAVGGGQFGEEGLMEHLCRFGERSAMEIRDEVLSAIRAFAQGRDQHDDQTIVVVKAK